MNMWLFDFYSEYKRKTYLVTFIAVKTGRKGGKNGQYHNS